MPSACMPRSRMRLTSTASSSRAVEVAAHPRQHLERRLRGVHRQPLAVRAARQQVLDGLQQAAAQLVLDQVGVGAGLQPPETRRRVAVRGEDEQRDVAARRVALQQPRELVAVHHRHVEVGDHEVGVLAKRHDRALGAVARRRAPRSRGRRATAR